MIIRSQDKRVIIDTRNMRMMYISHPCNSGAWIRAVVDGDSIVLGGYSTEEKAIKVLDMIQRAYNSIETMKIDGEAWRDNHYFEMPEDSEVKP